MPLHQIVDTWCIWDPLIRDEITRGYLFPHGTGTHLIIIPCMAHPSLLSSPSNLALKVELNTVAQSRHPWLAPSNEKRGQTWEFGMLVALRALETVLLWCCDVEFPNEMLAVVMRGWTNEIRSNQYRKIDLFSPCGFVLLKMEPLGEEQSFRGFNVTSVFSFRTAFFKMYLSGRENPL